MSMSRQATSRAVKSPPTARRSRETGGAGRSRSSAEIRQNAAGPCCHKAWLPTTHTSEPSAHARTAGTPTRRSPRPISRRWNSTAVNAIRTASARLAISLHSLNVGLAPRRSQPGTTRSSSMTWGTISGTTRRAGATG